MEAKRWGFPLQKPAVKKDRSPHLQLRDYLNEHTHIGYGIATNGGEWRLYARTAPASDFLAVDLGRVLSAPDSDADALFTFRLFFTLFGRQAFADNGRRLSEARSGAERFRREIEEQLRKQVFDAMESLARGFLDHSGNDLSARNLPEIYDSSLILLYRILFVLNAEARDLLPTGAESEYYKRFGLELVRRKLADAQSAEEYGDSATFSLWGRLEGLFSLINGSDAARNARYDVPRYNGGLFDPARYPFLQKCRVGDSFLRDALQTLTFRKDGGATGDKVTAFDYAGLGERHLGSIYEGLLEHVLRVDTATGGMVNSPTTKGSAKRRARTTRRSRGYRIWSPPRCRRSLSVSSSRRACSTTRPIRLQTRFLRSMCATRQWGRGTFWWKRPCFSPTASPPTRRPKPAIPRIGSGAWWKPAFMASI